MTVLITGATGMVGKGVLLECLDSSDVTAVLLLSRSHLELQHPKITEVLIEDLSQVSAVSSRLGQPQACFHCMGVSSVGMSEAQFSALTFDITAALADEMYRINPAMTFCYVSGTGTDGTEKSSIMWARVKGKTENYVLRKGFDRAYMFRPGFIIPERGIQSKTKVYQIIYNLISPFYSLIKKSKNITSTSRVGRAMLQAAKKGLPQTYLHNRAINAAAAAYGATN